MTMVANRVVVRPDPQNGFLIELMLPVSDAERVGQRAACSDLTMALRLASRYSELNGGCQIEDLATSK